MKKILPTAMLFAGLLAAIVLCRPAPKVELPEPESVRMHERIEPYESAEAIERLDDDTRDWIDEWKRKMKAIEEPQIADTLHPATVGTAFLAAD